MNIPVNSTNMPKSVFQVKIIDFGTAKQLGPGEKVRKLGDYTFSKYILVVYILLLIPIYLGIYSLIDPNIFQCKLYYKL